jgi:uncharacterized protein YkwD
MSHDGFTNRCTAYSSCAENVLFNEWEDNSAGVKAMTQWWESPSHRHNMEQSKYTKIGVAYSDCGEPDGHIYWTAFYAKD